MKRHLYILIFNFYFCAFGKMSAQDATPTPTPTPAVEIQKVDDAQNVQPENLQGVPKIAPNYESEDRTLPDLGRVGVDMMEQKPLSLNEAIALALENNKDIEVTRQNVRIAEFDLQSASGFYEPKFTGQTYYERATVPNISFFQPERYKRNDEFFCRKRRIQGVYSEIRNGFRCDVINNQRVGSDNPISIISPQYNSGLTFSVTQPLFRGRTFDQPRRTIEIAKRNLSLTDTQFRQRSIEIIATVQRAYWDLTYALRNLQVQRDGVKDAKDQLEHNRRLVDEGQLAPIDIVAAETQVANLEHAVYDALEIVDRAENNLKNLIAQNKNDSIWSESIVPTDSVELDAPRTTLPEALNWLWKIAPRSKSTMCRKTSMKLTGDFTATRPNRRLISWQVTRRAGVGGSLNPNFSNPFRAVAVSDRRIRKPVLCDTAASAQQTSKFSCKIVGGAGTTFTDILSNKYPTYSRRRAV